MFLVQLNFFLLKASYFPFILYVPFTSGWTSQRFNYFKKKTFHFCWCVLKSIIKEIKKVSNVPFRFGQNPQNLSLIHIKFVCGCGSNGCNLLNPTMQCDQEEEIPSRFGITINHSFINLPHLDLLAYGCLNT